MQKTAAKVTHRDRVPFGYVGIEFCHVDFYGFRAEEMKKRWRNIETKHTSCYDQNQIQIKDWRNEASFIRKQVKKSKPFYRFWYNIVERRQLAEAVKLSRLADELEEKNEKIYDKKLFSTYERHREIEDFLQQNGFVPTHTSSKRENTFIEIWIREE